MNILIREAHIQDPTSPFHGTIKDILVVDGRIRSIEDHIEQDGAQVVNAEGLSVSQGWVDIFADFADPGYEHKESLETGAFAAAAGGFTHVFLVPNTSPAIHSKSQVEYIIEKSRRLPVSLYPIGAITRNTDGKELAEMYDMKLYEAMAFSDGFNAIQSAGLLIKALQYVKAIDSVIIQIPDDKSINPGGLMNEGIVSTRLGLPGKPAMAEEIMVARDIKLARYTESKLHFAGISSAKSLEYIRRAKEGGIQVTCSVTPFISPMKTW
jgi:dihydroorotase